MMVAILGLPPVFVAFMAVCLIGTVVILARLRMADAAANFCTDGDIAHTNWADSIEPYRDGEILPVKEDA